MSPRQIAFTSAAVVVVTIVSISAFLLRPRVRGTRAAARPAAAAAPAQPVGRRIKAHLYYVSEDGLRLVSVDRDVPYGEGADQAREILIAELTPVSDPLVSPIPSGTTLRTLFVTPEGDAYADFSRQLVSGHSGGTTNELLAVHAIVDALTMNLPAIKTVQILVGGQVVETLAGHVDLRHPLSKNDALLQ